MTFEVAPAELDRLRATVREEAGYRPASRLREGMLVAERYELLRLLGEGGMGSVWAAKHVHTRKRVALKFLKGLGPVSAHARRRLIREARAATVIQHPNILAVEDIIDIGGAPMLVMDLLEGESLGDRLSRRRHLPLPEIADIVLKVVSAISAAHAAGIVHRDLKPDNIFLVARPDGTCDVRVLDFGLAKLTATEGDAATSGGLTRSGDIVGTPQYMAPEQAFGERDIDHRVDIWALGVILFECLTGRRPFTGDNLGQVLKRLMTAQPAPVIESAPEVPAELAAQVGQMLSLDRAQRPGDLSDVHRILSRYATSATSATSETRFVPRNVVRPHLVQRLAAALVVLVVVGGIGMHLGERLRRAQPLIPVAAIHAPDLVDAAAPPAMSLSPSREPGSGLATAAPDPQRPRHHSRPRKSKSASTVTSEDEARVPLFAE